MPTVLAPAAPAARFHPGGETGRGRPAAPEVAAVPAPAPSLRGAAKAVIEGPANDR